MSYEDHLDGAFGNYNCGLSDNQDSYGQGRNNFI